MKNKISIKPIGKSYQIVLKDDRGKITETQSGILIAQKGNDARPEIGKIVAVGAEVKYIKPGDWVIFKKFAIAADSHVEIDGEKVVIGADYEKDILAIIENYENN